MSDNGRVDRRADRDEFALTVVVPTRNEAENVVPLLNEIRLLQESRIKKVLFVDDSDDETPGTIANLDGEYSFHVGLIHRPVGQRVGGLGGAVAEGLRACKTDYAVVMDGDLQHPPSTIGDLIHEARTRGADLVVASRYRPDGSSAGLANGFRRLGSNVAGALARRLFPGPLRWITDPMSGFFLVRVDRLDLDHIKPEGFKILMELAVTNPHLRVTEVPFDFGERHAGETKAGVMEALRYLRHLLGLYKRIHRPAHHYQIHDFISVRSSIALPELGKFKVDQLADPPEIDVVVSWRPGTQLRRVDFRYREILGSIGFAIAIERKERGYRVGASWMLRFSPHVLYTNVVEPIIRWKLIEDGYALIHAACVETQGQAELVTAQTDTGKTTTMLQLLKNSDLRFMADDLVIANSDGRLWAYAKPLTISAHTLRAVNASRLKAIQRLGLPIQSRIHSRSGRRVAFVLAKRRMLPVATINMLVQMVVPPPKYHVESLIEDVAVSDTATAKRLFVIARGEAGERQLDESAAVETLLANCEDAFGFPPYGELERFIRFKDGRDLMEDYRRVVGSVLASRETTELTSDRYDWAERIASVLSDASEVVVDLTDSEPTIQIDTALVQGNGRIKTDQRYPHSELNGGRVGSVDSHDSSDSAAASAN